MGAFARGPLLPRHSSVLQSADMGDHLGALGLPHKPKLWQAPSLKPMDDPTCHTFWPSASTVSQESVAPVVRWWTWYPSAQFPGTDLKPRRFSLAAALQVGLVSLGQGDFCDVMKIESGWVWGVDFVPPGPSLSAVWSIGEGGVQ